jgi:hypothetical protein
MQLGKILAVLAFVFSSFSMAHAQETAKYIYGVVEYDATGKPAIYSTLDNVYEEIKVEKKSAFQLNLFDLTPLTTYMKKLNNEGWEVINCSFGVFTGERLHVYYLRKKI